MATAEQTLSPVFECFVDVNEDVDVPKGDAYQHILRKGREVVQRCFGVLMRKSIRRIQKEYGESFACLAELWGVKKELLEDIDEGKFSAINSEALDRLLGPLQVPFSALKDKLTLQPGSKRMKRWMDLVKKQQFHLLAATGPSDNKFRPTPEQMTTLFVLTQAVQEL